MFRTPAPLPAITESPQSRDATFILVFICILSQVRLTLLVERISKTETITKAVKV